MHLLWGETAGKKGVIPVEGRWVSWERRYNPTMSQVSAPSNAPIVTSNRFSPFLIQVSDLSTRMDFLACMMRSRCSSEMSTMVDTQSKALFTVLPLEPVCWSFYFELMSKSSMPSLCCTLGNVWDLLFSTITPPRNHFFQKLTSLTPKVLLYDIIHWMISLIWSTLVLKKVGWYLFWGHNYL